MDTRRVAGKGGPGAHPYSVRVGETRVGETGRQGVSAFIESSMSGPAVPMALCTARILVHKSAP